MRIPSTLLAIGLTLWAALLTPSGVLADDSKVQLKAVLILASNEEAPADARLSGIEPKLRKVLGFEHYSHYGEGSAQVTLPGSSTIQLGKGYTLLVEASEAADDGKIRLQVSWRKDGKGLMSTSTVVRRDGAPAILGGPSHGNGKLIVTLSVR